MPGQSASFITAACFAVTGLYTLYELLRLLFPFFAMRFELFSADFRAADASLADGPSKKDYRGAVTIHGTVKKLMDGSLTPEEEPYRKMFQRRLFLLACCLILSISVDYGFIPSSAEASVYAYCAVILGCGMSAAVVSRFRAFRIYDLARLLLRRQKEAEEAAEAERPRKPAGRKAGSRRGR